MTDTLVLKRVEVWRVPKSFGLGFSITWDTWFQNYDRKAKVRWLCLTIFALGWNITLRVPTKLYGIRGL
jgi:hypothetical protein